MPVAARKTSVVAFGEARFDISTGALVMGICNRTPDSFFDRGSYFELARFFEHAERLVAEGADLLDVGGVKAGPGPDVSVEEELDRVVPAIEELRRRFDVPVAVDTWRAEVLRQACAAGASVGNDISGFADPMYLAVASAAGASVVATHIRLAPRVPDPDPHYDDLVEDVKTVLAERALWAVASGIPPERVIVDAGLDLGKTPLQSLDLLRHSDELALLGFPLLLSASNKRFLGDVLGLEVEERRSSSLAAAALGIALGCRILRVHDVAGTVRVRDMLKVILEEEMSRPHGDDDGDTRADAD